MAWPSPAASPPSSARADWNADAFSAEARAWLAAPGHAAVGFLRGWAQTEMGDMPTATESFFAARAHNPRSIRVIRALSQALLSSGRPQEAVIALSWILEEPHPDRVALVALADALEATNRRAEAEGIRGKAG